MLSAFWFLLFPPDNMDSKHLTVGAVLLAAGSSRRFGSDKRHYVLTPGRTLLETSLAIYQRAFARVFLVLKPADRAWAHRLTGVTTIFAAESALGMGHSLAAGVRAARHLDALFIALADMPHIQVQTLERLQRAMTNRKCIAQPVYQGTPGHPVGFGSAYYRELQRLTGDAGAKGVIEAHRGKLVRVPAIDSGTVLDFDVPP